MPDYARPSNINFARSRTDEATGLNQFLIGLDHGPSGISTDSARGSETTGNNRDDPGKRHTRRGRPTPPWNGPALRVNDGYIRRSWLTNVQSSHGPPDDHPLDFARALKNGEDFGGHGKSHRHTRAGLPIAVRMGVPLPFPVPRTGSSRTGHRPLRMLTVLPRPTRPWVHDDEPGAGIAAGRRADAGLLLVCPRYVLTFRLLLEAR
jgi:hypothetical protein